MEDEKNQNNVDTQATTDNAQNKEQKPENKNEGEKTKKQVAQKGEDGSIVFKNQDELDGFIRRIYAKGAEKAEQGETSKQVQETQNKQEDNGQEMEQQTVPADYLLTKVALAMAKAGVNAEKVERASRLVDINKIQENGTINDKSLEDEINAVIAEFPELKNAKEEEKQEKGFKFGATEGTSNSNQTQKRPVATKRWNRFNSF